MLNEKPDFVGIFFRPDALRTTSKTLTRPLVSGKNPESSDCLLTFMEQ